MNNNDREFIARKIRAEYTEKTHTELDELRALNARVKRPAKVFAYLFGSVGALILGCGMSLLMTDIAATVGLTAPTVPGVVIGVVGLAMTVVNYPIYTAILSSRRKKFAGRVIELSNRIIKN